MKLEAHIDFSLVVLVWTTAKGSWNRPIVCIMARMLQFYFDGPNSLPVDPGQCNEKCGFVG